MSLTPRENMLLVYNHQIPEWIPSTFKDTNFFLPEAQIERWLGSGSGPDAFGVQWVYVPEVQAPMPDENAILLDDITLWKDKVTIPDLDEYDWEEDGADFLYFAEPDKLNFAMSVNGMFERLHACMGMTEALCAIMTEEEACYDFFGAVADHKIRMMERTKKYYHADIFNMHDDYGMNDRPFMSVDVWRRLLKPHLKRCVEACHDFGMIYQHHSCGFIEPFVDDMVEIGVDAMDTWQVCNTNMRAIKDKYQDRLTFLGGLDNQGVLDRQGVTEEEIRAEIMRAIDLMAPGGSYVPAAITIGFDFIPVLNDILDTYGREFYKKPENRVRAAV